MRSPTLSLLLFSLSLVPAALVYAGGWATVTVEELPEYLMAQRPVTLHFTIRQHGVEPLRRLEPQIIARSGSLEATATASELKEAGRYAATLTLPRAGDWILTIRNGFGGKVTLLPLSVIAAGATPPAAKPAAERGRDLFVAKGCVTCHAHDAVTGDHVDLGPNLTARTFPVDYLGQFLADPSIRSANQMPNLHLKPSEIAALTAFINSDMQRQARR